MLTYTSTSSKSTSTSSDRSKTIPQFYFLGHPYNLFYTLPPSTCLTSTTKLISPSPPPLPSIHLASLSTLLTSSLPSSSTGGITITGSGKTHLLTTLSTQIGVEYLSGTRYVSNQVGLGVEVFLRDLENSKVINGRKVMIIDDFWLISLSRKEGGGSTSNLGLISSILTCFNTSPKPFLIVAVKNVDDLDSAIFRNGRIDGVFDLKWEEDDLRKVYAQELPVFVKVDRIDVKLGWSVTDVLRYVKGYTRENIDDNIDETTETFNLENFNSKMSEYRPKILNSASEIVKVYWEDIGGMREVKEELIRLVVQPERFTEVYRKWKVKRTRGVMLYGPPGCSKTLMAKALSTELGGRFILIKGPELVSKYLGEGEKKLKAIFKKGRECKGVVFIDEVDSIAGKRDGGGGSERMLSQLLTELDGVESEGGSVVVMATNRPDLIDEAVLREGRVEEGIYVGLPDVRKEIVEVGFRGTRFDGDLEECDKLTEGFTGAEIIGICRAAKIEAVIAEKDYVGMEEFRRAVGKAERGVTEEMLEFYRKYGESRSIK
ncbi:hypothetical protein TL16_g01257 [Triparma laevis f. inornata]|uniref:AAA+ ATPase domain-containing protein n=1 Tax=Triparma laevis f. inornata TaxID=1714386 RepID=A0A9W7DRZ3_9STRA|nr:hypothetical protein TL16_g01257 [Triparma laevis f. inornata]